MNAPGNRRQADRRQADRRKPPLSTAEDGWFSAWGAPGNSGRATRGADSSLLEPEPGAHGDSHFIAREAKRLVSTDGAALPRILRTYVAARAGLSLALVLAPFLALLGGGKPPVLVILVSLAYASQAMSLWLLQGSPHGPQQPDHLLPRQWLWTIGVDLVAFSALRVLEPQALLNYTALLVLPVLMSGVLMRRLVALATAAALSLLLMLAVWPQATDDGDMLLLLSQAGLAGAGLFLIAMLASELSQRLAREERSARSSLEMARQQTLLNRLVIEEMADGVLVVDRRGQVRAINPAARQLLGPAGAGMAVPSPLVDEPGLRPLQRALDQAYAEGSWPASVREIALTLPDGERRMLQLRARFTRRSGIAADGTPPEDICVLFLEDMRTVQGRARNDKLAAMGRVSAGIAHEIRNPLAAIAQANALLLEDELPAQQQRLSCIVADNVERLKRIVDDVLAVVPGTAAPATLIDATADVALVCDEWRRSALPEAQPGVRLVVDLPARQHRVRFDTDHLRRVLVNLLDNASRHASDEPGAIRLRLSTGPAIGAVTVSVASDGVPIPPDVEHHLFEPFFSTRSRGTGLGLYICRELCERHGASMDFNLAPPGSRHRNVFNVVMRAADTGTAAGAPASPTTASGAR
ncbi:MAG: ATP-binding protein [Aquabacterium sp.]|nr:ATP-binding protein [Aquabacterium sp.]